MVINQIIMINLTNSDSKNEWKSLFRESLEQYDLLEGGFNRLIAFDRLESYFKNQKTPHHPVKFFFNYIRGINSEINGKMEGKGKDIHTVFFDEFETYVSKSMNSDEIIETIRCLIKIFYKVKRYRDLKSYKGYFLKFKEKGQLQTELSLRKFVKNMEWVRNESFLAPSYHINWNMINVCAILVYFSFNPLLEKPKIFKIIDTLPFFISPQFSRSTFSLEVFGYFILPKAYLKDLYSFIRKLENSGYILNHRYFSRNSEIVAVNLNYFRQFSQRHCIINPTHQFYDKMYETEFKIEYGEKFYETKINLLGFLLLDRIRFFSISGFGFERSIETLEKLKSDLMNEVATEHNTIQNLKQVLNIFHNKVKIKTRLLHLIESNENFGFFYIRNYLNGIISIIGFIDDILEKNSEIKNLEQLNEVIKNQSNLNSLERNILINNAQVMSTVLNEIIRIYFISRVEYRKHVENFQYFYDLFNSFFNLKIFNLSNIKKIIVTNNLKDRIYEKREENLKKSYEKWKLYKVTKLEVDKILNEFLNHDPPIIEPFLLNTFIIGKYVKDSLHLILADSLVTKKYIGELKKYFPLTNICYFKDESINKNLIWVDFRTPNITIKEKRQLYSILYNRLNNDIIFAKSYKWSGFIPAFSIKNFYDLQTNQFLYSKDLFNQYFLFIQKLLGDNLQPIPENLMSHNKFWSREKSISDAVEKINDRYQREQIKFIKADLKKLLHLHLNLDEYILDTTKFKEKKQQNFFKNYIKSIKFIPAFQHFDLCQYFLYFYPADMNEVDFKLLLLNNFQKIKYPACIDKSNSLFIKFIFPFGAPNIKYLKWLRKSKRIIREYCGFFVKKIYQILQFDYNLGPEGWQYNATRFKTHMQNTLFDTEYEFQIVGVKEFNIVENPISSHVGPDSPEFKSLSQIFNWCSIDIKSYLGTKKKTTINHIKNLSKGNLIFSYLSLKNLGLHDKVYIIIPNLKQKAIDHLVKIFSFFNLVFIYEIEGEYFIHGFDNEVKFPKGLMIKIYFPKCDLHEFERLFDLLFEYLEIKDYIILNDLVDGKNLIKSIYGGLDFLKSYNPLKNFKWNEQEKRWMNPKVFTSKFEPIYQDLIPKDKP
jgi:hypothetical protein